jgi:transcriptional regulator with XRE-family HTH domain
MISFISPEDTAIAIAERTRVRRLADNLSRKTLAEKSGVSEASIKRFETTGEIALVSLLKIAFTLDCLQNFEGTFAPKEIVSIKDITAPSRSRGRK